VKSVEVPTLHDHTAARLLHEQEVLLELFAIGDRLYGRENSILLKIGSAPSAQPGDFLLYSSEPVRDIEVINLDGLPEVEALKLLGVDEKGNDLLTLAKQQEQQRIEEAEEADAIAAVPELQALHDQFARLRAERVAAPF